MSGKQEVYVESFPDRSWKAQVSTEGGGTPCWSRDGSQLYYARQGGRILMVVDAAARPRFGIPRTFLDCFGYDYYAEPVRLCDVDPKGRLLAMGLFYGGRPVWRHDFPDAWQIITTGSHEDRARLEQWLRGDPARRLAPQLERWLGVTPVTRINIVENWMEELRRLAPTR
jgi:hypothetical protein